MCRKHPSDLRSSPSHRSADHGPTVRFTTHLRSNSTTPPLFVPPLSRISPISDPETQQSLSHLPACKDYLSVHATLKHKMAGPTASRPRNSGIRKHQQRRDRDGDLIMGAAPRVSPARPSPRNANSSGPRASSTPTAAFTELKVTGWTDDKEMNKLIGFLERHSSRRSPNASSKGSTMPPKMIKRHRVSSSDNVLTIWIRPEDVTAFSKINGFTFTSVHGTQKLNIVGPGIRSKEPNANAAMDTTTGEGDRQDNSSSNATRDLLRAFIERRYFVDEKLLNLSTIADDEEIAKSGMWKSAATQMKFFPALMIVCDGLLKTPEEKREKIHSVTLSGNNLPNLGVVRDLATTLPHIKNLDLSGNKFASIRDLKPWKNRFRNLEHLIVEVEQPGWEEELVSWFPKLRILNAHQVRPDPISPPAAAPAAAPVAVPVTAPASELTAEQEAMVVYVQKETNLKRQVAIQCLEAGSWNIDAAAQLFLAQKDALPAESFN